MPTVMEPVRVGWATECPAASPAWGPLCPGAPHKWGTVQAAAGTGSWCPTEARAPGGSDQRPAVRLSKTSRRHDAVTRLNQRRMVKPQNLFIFSFATIHKKRHTDHLPVA